MRLWGIVDVCAISRPTAWWINKGLGIFGGGCIWIGVKKGDNWEMIVGGR